jgi:acetyltransferase-like isoleucine patch superfamily enzyme
LNILSFIKSYIRLFYLRKNFPTSVIYSGVYIDKFSELGSYSVLFKDVTLINSNLGAYSFVQSRSLISNVEIGKFCSIASNVNIGLGSHPMHMVSTSPVFYDNSQSLPNFMIGKKIFFEELPRTTIESDVWIGHGAMIKAGVTIGTGAVIGAGSVVTKDIPPYSIAAGNPCKVIKSRFSEDIINRLLLSKWWIRSDDELKGLAHLFLDPLKFLDVLGS